MSTYSQLLAEGIDRLSGLEYSDAALEARELLGLAVETDCRSARFEEMLRGEADEAAAARFSGLCERRLSGEPLQYILGEWDFYGFTFSVGRGVLIPRQDTELLVDIALKLYKNADSLGVIDLCAGTGCIGLSIEKLLKNVRLTPVEKYDPAFGYLLENIKRMGSKAKAVRGDVTDESLPGQLRPADLIVCNPPYLTAEDMGAMQKEVTAEPEEALFGGSDGLEYYRTVTRLWKKALRPGGALLFEIGSTQSKEVTELMIQHGFRDVRTRRDLAGNDRAVIGFKREV